MPVTTTKSSILAELGNVLDQAIQQHANDPTEYGIQRLPAGINGGVAKLTECTFGKYKTGPNQGKPFFRCAGVMVEPQSIIVDEREVQVAGCQTSVMEPICDTKNAKGEVTSRSEHVANVLNIMRMLAGEEFTSSATTGADLDQLSTTLKQVGPHFKVSTSVRKAQKKGDPDGVWENWHGSKGLENYVPPAAGGVQDDSRQAQTSVNGSGQSSHPTNHLTGSPQQVAQPPNRLQQFNAAAAKTGAVLPEPTSDVANAADAFNQMEQDADAAAQGQEAEPDIAALTELAVGGDTDSQNHLSAIAEQMGLKEAADAAPGWAEVGEIILAAQAGNDSSAEGPGWKVSDACHYVVLGKDGKPQINAKTKQPNPPLSCEVTAVNSDGTVNLKCLTNPKLTFKGVTVDQLLPV